MSNVKRGREWIVPVGGTGNIYWDIEIIGSLCSNLGRSLRRSIMMHQLFRRDGMIS